MRSVSVAGRIAALGAVVLAVVVVAVVLFRTTSGGYEVKARFINAGQLVRGNPVEVGGTKAGTVKKIEITPDGQAQVTLGIDDTYKPLRQGTKAIIRAASQSGIANRYVDLQLPSGRDQTPIKSGSVIGVDQTQTPVELDQLFNTLDPRTRRALQGFIQGYARFYADSPGKPPFTTARQTNLGYQYLNPALATSSRFFGELTRDQPLLQKFLVDSAKLVTAVAERKADLAALIGNLNTTFRAIGSQKLALADAISRFPDFMRRANTTFVNLRATLDTLDPLVSASRPVARRLGPFLRQLQPLARDAVPTIRDLSNTIRRPGANNDLVELDRTFPALARIALDTRKRSVRPGGRTISVGRTRGSFPESIDALNGSAKVIGKSRPYTPDFTGWLDDFSHAGSYDALGGISRAHVFINSFSPGPAGGIGAPIPLDLRGAAFKQFARIDQFKRCPGAAEERAADGSNVFSPDEQKDLNCDESDRATGNIK